MLALKDFIASAVANETEKYRTGAYINKNPRPSPAIPLNILNSK
jgi:hypothetical protein